MITVIIFMIYSSIKTSKKTGKEGEKGIAGVPGNVGRYGECNETCGVSTCVNLITNHVNTIFKNRKGNDKSIKNIYFLNKINLICNSGNYRDILVTNNNNNRPNEYKLIEFIKKTATILNLLNCNE